MDRLDESGGQIRWLDGFFEYALALLLVLNCNSVYQRAADGSLIEELCTVLGGIMLLVAVVGHRQKFNPEAIFSIFLVLAICAVYLYVNRDAGDRRLFVYQFIFFLPCMIFYLHLKSMQGGARGLTSLLFRFSDVILVIATLSTIVWFFVEIAGIELPGESLTISWGSVKTVPGSLGLYYKIQTDATFGLGWYRNSGIFCEAPMHSLCLTFALFIELFLRKKVSGLKVALLILIIFTTVSSTGIVCVALSLMLRYWLTVSKTRSGGRIIGFLALICLLVPVLGVLASWLMEAKSSTSSFSTRLTDYVAAFQAWRLSPIFGSGYNQLGDIYQFKYDALSSGARGFSNTMMAALVQGGVWLFSLYVYPIVTSVARGIRHSDMRLVCIGILLTVLFLTAIFNTRFIMMLIIAYGVALSLERASERAKTGSIRPEEGVA